MIRVAAAQSRARDQWSDNLHRLSLRAQEAARAGAQLVVFPEATMCRFGTDLAAVAQPTTGPFARGVSEVARRLGLIVVVGMFRPATDGRVFNTMLVTEPSSIRRGGSSARGSRWRYWWRR